MNRQLPAWREQGEWVQVFALLTSAIFFPFSLKEKGRSRLITGVKVMLHGAMGKAISRYTLAVYCADVPSNSKRLCYGFALMKATALLRKQIILRNRLILSCAFPLAS